MGIQINGNTNNINAGIGSLSIEDLNELDIVGVATASNFKTGTSNVHSTGYECTNINATGIITATSFVGSGANLTGLPAGTTINTNADNRIITGSGTANTLNGEATLTYDGNTLQNLQSSNSSNLTLKATSNSFNSLILDSNRSADTQFAILDGRWNGNPVARIQYVTGSDGTNKDDGYMAFHSRTSGASLTERLRITTHGGTVVSKGGSPNTASGWAGLEVKAAASEHQLVLSSTDNASNSNQVRLGFKLHPSNDNERVKAAIVCQGSGGGYGEVSRMMFCIDSVGDNGNALPNSASDEKLRITSSGLIQIGGDISNTADIDTTNTRLTIKQSANNPEDGIYIERSGERRGHYIYVGGAHGVNDGLCFGTNQLGTHTDILALDRSGAAYLAGSLYPTPDTTHNLGSDSYTWDRAYIRNAYPEQGTEYSTSGSSFANNVYHDTGFSRASMGGLNTNGTYIITLYCDNYAAGGGNYGCTYTWIVGMRNQSTNQNTTNEVPLLSVTGHSTNNQLIELRTKREGSAYGGDEWVVWRPQTSLSTINGASGRNMKWRIQRIGRSSLG